MVRIVKDFITKEEEDEILSHIRPSKVKLGQNRNRINRFGSTLPYAGPVLGPIPEWVKIITKRIISLDYMEDIDSLTVNEYHKGQSIDWHIDSPTSGPVICVLSLKGSALMGLKKGDELQNYLVQPRSLTVLTDEQRWEWKHCIYPVEEPRFSIVFRKGTI